MSLTAPDTSARLLTDIPSLKRVSCQPVRTAKSAGAGQGVIVAVANRKEIAGLADQVMDGAPFPWQGYDFDERTVA